MKSTVSLYDFRRAFEQCRPDNFSHEGLEVLFDYLEELESDTGEELELDVIALCCDYSEDSFEDVAANYSIDLSNHEEIEAQLQAVIDYLQENTQYCGVTSDNKVVYFSSF